MGGFREGTPSDGAYGVLILLTVLSYLAIVPLLVLYLVLVVSARRSPAGSRRAA